VNVLPGTQFRYSGGGITVAQQLVVDLLKEPFPKIMRKLILDPLDMQNSTFEQPLPGGWARSAATAHPSKNHPVEGKWHVYPEMAAAGLWSTPSDLARAGVALQLALKGEAKGVLSTKTVVQMMTPGIDEHIGIGFFLSGQDEKVRFGHGGWDEGFVAQMTMYKGVGKGAVIMLNSNEGNPMLFEIEHAIAKEYEWPGYFHDDEKRIKLSPDILATYAGEYTNKTGLKFSVANEKGTLTLSTAEEPPVELRPVSETNFFVFILNTEVTFDRSEKGEVRGLTVKQEGTRISAERKQ
jgi:CubicO group peptidase (beta-lactamase class C family)